MDEYGVQTAIVSPSIQKQWHTEWSVEQYYKLCVNSFKAQQEMIKENPLRFGQYSSVSQRRRNETNSSRGVCPDSSSTY